MWISRSSCLSAFMTAIVAGALLSLPAAGAADESPSSKKSKKKQAENNSPSSTDNPVAAIKPAGTSPQKKPAEQQPFFAARVLPILKANCVRCHGVKVQKSELNLSTQAGILSGGESGKIIKPGDADESPLFEMISEGHMPPDEKDRLTPKQVETIRLWIVAGAKFEKPDRPTRKVTQHQIVPLLHLRCTVCHGLRRREAGLDLRSKASMLKGGKSGPVFVPGKPGESLILKKIRSGKMPPTRQATLVSVKPMDPLEVELLAKWIAQGATETAVAPDVATTEPDPLVSDEDRQFWAFQPPKQSAVPNVKTIDQVSNPIDAFVLHRLEQKELTLSPPADRRTLIRRASFGLTGLPPEPDDINRYLADSDPAAYETMIDRLLASPGYGERWARIWLDLAGYADSEGIQHADPLRPHVYRYRDYVIRSLNADKPYDRFLLEQIAGDELADYEQADVITSEMADNLIATGFLRLGADATFANITAFVPDRSKVISDEIEILSSTVMGLSMKCARCHSHKFDPIPQRDYYRLLDVFKGAFDEHDWLVSKRQSGKPGSKDRYLPFVPTTERRAWTQLDNKLNTAVNALKSDIRSHTIMSTRKYVDGQIAKLPKQIQADVRAMLATPKEKRSDIQKYLAGKFEKELTIDAEQLKKLDAGYAKAVAELEGRIKSLEAQRKPEPLVRALWDRGEPSPTYLLRRGNYRTPGRQVGAGVPSVLTDGRTPLDVKPPWPGSKKTGRRLAFARWLISPDHPLTARVIVNRIWKQHFGTGIVSSLDNFGKAGARPTHPQLLDWLAVEFVRQGWSLKRLHRTIMSSQTYRQRSQVTDAQERLDPENRLLSRMPLRRLEAEMLRDTLLLVSDRLDNRPFGPAESVTARADGLVTSTGSTNGWRKSIYVTQRRSQIPTILANFDLPPMSPNCVERRESIVAPQALHLMNNGMVHQLSIDFAGRILREAGTDRTQQIERIYLLTLGRPPTDDERSAGLKAMKQLEDKWQQDMAGKGEQNKKKTKQTPADAAATRALANYCHAMMNSAAFLYID